MKIICIFVGHIQFVIIDGHFMINIRQERSDATGYRRTSSNEY